MYNPNLSRDQRNELLALHTELVTVHGKATAVAASLHDEGKLAGEVIDVQLAISEVMDKIGKAVFTPER